MDKILAIAQLVATLVPQMTALLQQALEAHATGDQARLDALHDQAVAAAEALRPAGP